MLVEALLDLSKQGYKVTFEINGVNPKFFAITLNHHGLNLRGHLIEEKYNEDFICRSLKYLKERLDLTAQATEIK